MVSEKHLAALATACIEGPSDWFSRSGWRPLRPFEREERWTVEAGAWADFRGIARMLQWENVASLTARYDGRHPVNFVPVLPCRDRYPVATLLKLIHCYEYQACEHEGWTDSAAHKLCRRLESALTRCVVGYDAAPWGI